MAASRLPLLLLVALAITLTSCNTSGTKQSPPPGDKDLDELVTLDPPGGPYRVVRDKDLVLNESVTLKNGEQNAWKLPPGRYRVLMVTPSGDGAQVELIGGDCPKSPETKAYTSDCELRQPGQIVVSNPKSPGMGSEVSVVVLVHKLRRAEGK